MSYPMLPHLYFWPQVWVGGGARMMEANYVLISLYSQKLRTKASCLKDIRKGPMLLGKNCKVQLDHFTFYL